jgi:hypothetical protein
MKQLQNQFPDVSNIQDRRELEKSNIQNRRELENHISQQVNVVGCNVTSVSANSSFE